jgi:hypothetical protein
LDHRVSKDGIEVKTIETSTTPEVQVTLLKRYLQNHCEASDREGTSALCECKLCLETRVVISSLSSFEFCICAAIVAEDSRIFRGHRHSDALMAAGHAGTKGSSLADSQGFITSTGRFVDRVEGARLQEAAGIVSIHTKRFTDFLFSEDLY